MEEKDELLRRLAGKIDGATSTIDRLKLVEKIQGVEKLTRKFQQEIKFLKKVQSTGKVQKQHLQSTNLIHLDAIVARLLRTNGPISVIKPFKHQGSRLEVDIICDMGASWIKVIARNAKALTLISMGNGEYGQKSVLDQAKSYLQCAKCHPYLYKPPNIIFHFAYGIEESLATCLERIGVIVEGDKINCKDIEGTTMHEVERENNPSTWMYSLESARDSLDVYDTGLDLELDSLYHPTSLKTEIKLLNLDVSTLLAYVTNLTNGYSNFYFRGELLNQQAQMEKRHPVKPILENIFSGRELIVCQTAYENFMKIMNEIGGPKEYSRTLELLKKIRLVNDIPTGRIMERLNLGGHIKERSRLVFATGENMESITVSANKGFVRAARMQGIECAVFLHEPRSLSECKQSFEQ